MAEVVERSALGCQHGAAFAANAGDFRARLEQRAIAAADFELHLPIHQRKCQTRQIKACQHALLASHQTQFVRCVGRHNGVCGQVPRAAQVFQQGHAHQRLQHHIGQG